MRRLASALGFALALLYLAAFGYGDYFYLTHAGQWWIAAAPLNMAAQPYILTVSALNGSVSFNPDNATTLLSAAAFGAILAYAVGWIAEGLLRGLWRLALGRARSANARR